MYAFEPVSPTYAISDTVVEHRLHSRDRTRADLPGGYRLTLRTRELHGRLEAALAAPSPTGPARICTARISAHTPTPTTARILDAVTRYAPALPDARDARPPLQAIARLLTTGAVFQRQGEPGLFVRFGHAEAWLEGRRLSIALGSPGSGLSLALGGPWDAPSTARLTAAVLRELTEAEQLAGELAALLEPGTWRALPDRWHPTAALVLPANRRPDPDDPYGRRISRALRQVQHELRAARPDWDFQELISVEGAAVALRVTPLDGAVPRLVRKVVGDGACGPGELGNTRTTFHPAALPTHPDLPPAPPPHQAPSLDLHVAPKDERYSYGVTLDIGNWAYALEPQAVFYGPGWYPFHEHVMRREKDPTAPPTTAKCPPAAPFPPGCSSPPTSNTAPGATNTYSSLPSTTGSKPGCTCTPAGSPATPSCAPSRWKSIFGRSGCSSPPGSPGPCATRRRSRAGGSSTCCWPRGANADEEHASRGPSSVPGIAKTRPARRPDASPTTRATPASLTVSPHRRSRGGNPGTGSLTDSKDSLVNAVLTAPATCTRRRPSSAPTTTAARGPAVRFAYGLIDTAAAPATSLVGVLTLGSPTQAAVLTSVFGRLTPYVESLELNRLLQLRLLRQVPPPAGLRTLSVPRPQGLRPRPAPGRQGRHRPDARTARPDRRRTRSPSKETAKRSPPLPNASPTPPHPPTPRELGTTSSFIPLTQLTNTLPAKTPGQRDMQGTDRKSPDYQE